MVKKKRPVQALNPQVDYIYLSFDITFDYVRYHAILKICKHIFQHYCNWNVVNIAVAMRCQGIHLEYANYLYNILQI